MSWQEAIRSEWRQKESARSVKTDHFPLIEQAFDAEEIISVVDVIVSGQLTMSSKVREFEKKIAEYVNAPYAVMVNSGSSANLLAMAVASNPLRHRYFKSGDEILVPAVCWSTSVWPIAQMNLKPVFVDVDPKTLNIDLRDAKKKLTSKTKGIVAIHILGNSAPIDELMNFTEQNRLMLIEDTCESLGSTYQGRKLGTFGDFGTYSFYYSHHMTTGEGGVVVCKTQEDVDLLRCLRAHGWTRELSNRAELEKKYSHIDPRFLFVNVGYNFRPMEIQGALGICQLNKLNQMNESRIKNHVDVMQAFRSHPKWNQQLEFVEESPGLQAVWFGFSCLLNPKYGNQLRNYLEYLNKKGVENRPIVSGNFVHQPALAQLGLNLNPSDFKGAETVHQRGFFIGSHTVRLSPEKIQYLVDTMLSYPFK
jgi:CDP-6-deoxy-D-xylo-4-hexulose-3-dehydrase